MASVQEQPHHCGSGCNRFRPVLTFGWHRLGAPDEERSAVLTQQNQASGSSANLRKHPWTRGAVPTATRPSQGPRRKRPTSLLSYPGRKGHTRLNRSVPLLPPLPVKPGPRLSALAVKWSTVSSRQYNSEAPERNPSELSPQHKKKKPSAGWAPRVSASKVLPRNREGKQRLNLALLNIGPSLSDLRKKSRQKGFPPSDGRPFLARSNERNETPVTPGKALTGRQLPDWSCFCTAESLK